MVTQVEPQTTQSIFQRDQWVQVISPVHGNGRYKGSRWKIDRIIKNKSAVHCWDGNGNDKLFHFQEVKLCDPPKRESRIKVGERVLLLNGNFKDKYGTVVAIDPKNIVGSLTIAIDEGGEDHAREEWVAIIPSVSASFEGGQES